MFDNIEKSDDNLNIDNDNIKNSDLNNDDIPEKQKIINTCKNVLQYIYSENGNKLYEHNLKKIVNYISNIRLWLKVTNSISKEEYLDKIDEINISVNEIFEINDSEIKNSKKNNKKELIDLCNILSQKIDNNDLQIDISLINILKNNIKSCFKWIDECHNLDNSNIVFLNKINELNELCSSMIQ